MLVGNHSTEVAIPEGWEPKRLGELFEFRNGVNADKDAYGSGIPFINVLEPIAYSHLHGPEIPGRVSLPSAIEKSYLVRAGDVLFNRTSETQGEVGLASVYLGNLPVVFGGFVICGRPKNGCLHPLYSGYGLRSQFVRQQVVALGQGAVRANIGQDNLGQVVAAIPPLDEQRAIAGALSDVDALLGVLDRMLTKKRDLKQAAMQQLLTGQTRLPGFKGDWEEKTLGDCLLARPDYGINAPAVPFAGSLPSYLRITDISEYGRFSPSPRVAVDSPDANQFFLEEGDLVFARTGASVGKSYLYDPADGELVFAGFLIRVHPNPELLNPSYLSSFVTTRRYWNWVQLNSMRSGQPGINGNEYATLPVPVPPTVDEQTAIAEVLSDMDAEIAALERRREKTAHLKQGMMQELLTGKTRLI